MNWHVDLLGPASLHASALYVKGIARAMGYLRQQPPTSKVRPHQNHGTRSEPRTIPQTGCRLWALGLTKNAKFASPLPCHMTTFVETIAKSFGAASDMPPPSAVPIFVFRSQYQVFVELRGPPELFFGGIFLLPEEEDIWLALCCIVEKHGLDEHPRLMIVQMNISSILYTVWACQIVTIIFC